MAETTAQAERAYASREVWHPSNDIITECSLPRGSQPSAVFLDPRRITHSKTYLPCFMQAPFMGFKEPTVGVVELDLPETVRHEHRTVGGTDRFCIRVNSA